MRVYMDPIYSIFLGSRPREMLSLLSKLSRAKDLRVIFHLVGSAISQRIGQADGADRSLPASPAWAFPCAPCYPLPSMRLVVRCQTGVDKSGCV